MQLFDYLIRVSVCMAICYLPYFFLFRKLTFFSLNRCYLLLITIISLIIPVIHIKINEPLLIHHLTQTIVMGTNAYSEANDSKIISSTQFDFNWILIIKIIYWCVCIAIIVKLIYRILLVIHNGITEGVKVGGIYLIEGPSEKNSSFFSFIFINNDNASKIEREQIIEHEKVHITLLHSLDKVFIEVIKSFFWFNPFMFQIGKSLYKAHEFEVDRILAAKYNAKSYATLLLKLSAPNRLLLVNAFGANSLKSRVNMIFNPRSTVNKKFLYLLVLPFVAILCCFFSVETSYSASTKKKDFILVLDAGHGGNQLGAVSVTGRTEKDLTLQIVKKIASLANESGIKTILTRSHDQFTDLADRVKYTGDAFVSIHFNESKQGENKNGTSIFIDGHNKFTDSKKLALNFKFALQELKGLNGNQMVNVYYTPNEKPLYILKKNPSPSILIELGYISDKKDMDYVLNQQNQHQIAEKCIQAIEAYNVISN